MTHAILIETLLPYYLRLHPDEWIACRLMSAAVTWTHRAGWYDPERPPKEHADA